ncbi:TraB/GumN family protein [Hallella colorans]|uniref:TraB/GumN family protein n=1 Tax=Hallella colorans TaxID=1703337 RepID=UPI00248EFE4C|nr:TraB/GumN family protein [Hallella colorans]
MRKFFITIFFVLFYIVGVHAQLLYKISGNNLPRPSYIIGTHHLANVGFVNKIKGVNDALTNTKQVYGELIWDNMTNADSVAYMKQQMTLPDGKTLKDVLSTEQYAKLNAYLKSAMQADLNNPIVQAQMGKLTPLAMVMQLTILSYMTKHIGEFDPTSTFDQYFQAQAKKNKEYVGGLETVAFQAKVLYGSMPLQRQLVMLECFLDHTTFMEEMAEKMSEAFYAQDLNALKAAQDEKLNNSCDNTPEENDLLIYSRNTDWLKKMPAIMAKAPTFFVVGALHLPGDKGVLDGLRKLGYTVEGVR